MKKYVLLGLVVVILGIGYWTVFGFPQVIQSPNETPTIEPHTHDQELVEAHVRERIATLAPEVPVLGGNWYVTSVTVDEDHKTGTMAYEDGHIAGNATFTYRIHADTVLIENIVKK
jgi:hypothetical protein